MWGLDALGLPVAADGSVTLPFWAAASVAVLLLVLFVLALVRTGAAGTLVFIALVGFGVWGVVAWTNHEAAAQRRALEQRAVALDTQALVPGSALGCLQATGADTIDSACERAVFASPQSAAAAVGLVAERLMLLNQQTGLAGKDESFDGAVNALRTSLEQDRFGIVAQVLASRYGCTTERCDMLRVLHDPAKVRNDLRDRTFDATLARHATGWATAEASPPGGAVASGTAAPIPDRYTLPSAESIPAVNIMTAEPTPRAEPAPAPKAVPTPPAAPRRATHSHRQSAAPPANPPIQIRPQ
jgi:hypothetical protein